MYEKDIYLAYYAADIKAFPVDCMKIAECIGYKVMSYTEYADISGTSIRVLLAFSKDAMTFRKEKLILLNESMPDRRKLFSLAHELGHIILPTQNEDEADGFASELLAPWPVIRARRMTTADEVKDFFGISISAANRAIWRYKRHFMENCEVMQLYEWFGYHELAHGTCSDTPSRSTIWSPVGKYAVAQPVVKINRNGGFVPKAPKTDTRRIGSLKGRITRLRKEMVAMSFGDEERYAEAEKQIASLLRELRYVTGDKEFTW